jgi:hypothetical protein
MKFNQKPNSLLCNSQAFRCPGVAFSLGWNGLIPIPIFSSAVNSSALILSGIFFSQWFPGKSGGVL